MPYVFRARKVLMASAHRSIGAAFLIRYPIANF